MARAFPSEPDLSRDTFTRILLVKPSSLGDVVHALPVLHGLRGRYPQATIDWLVAVPFAPLLDGHPDVNELIRFDRKRFGRLGRNPGVTGEFMRFVRDLRTRRYDLVIDLQGLFRTGFLAWASGASVRIGFRDAREGAWLFYTHRLRIDDSDAHAVDRNFAVANALGFKETGVKFNLALGESDRAQAATLLRENERGGHQPLVAVVPGARSETKVWLPERFAETIDVLQGGSSVRCALLGGPDEASVCERIRSACRSKPTNLAGQTNLREFAAVIALADVVLCHDSAAAHLAVALERPLVCLIGPTNPRRTGPYRRIGDIVRLDLDCSPCYLRHVSQCTHDHRCMRELDTTTVAAAVRRCLERSAVSRV